MVVENKNVKNDRTNAVSKSFVCLAYGLRKPIAERMRHHTTSAQIIVLSSITPLIVPICPVNYCKADA